MAKGSNTWCKKLMNKQKRHAQRFARKPHALTFSLEAQVVGEARDAARRKSPQEYLAPMVKGFNPGRGKKGTLSREYRAMVEARNAKREAFFAGM